MENMKNNILFWQMSQKENYISYNGEEVYAIVPQSTQYAMKVESFDWDENANAMVRDTLYISQKAAPVILKCNLSELSYNVVITLTKRDRDIFLLPIIKSHGWGIVCI